MRPLRTPKFEPAAASTCRRVSVSPSVNVSRAEDVVPASSSNCGYVEESGASLGLPVAAPNPSGPCKTHVCFAEPA